MDHKPAIALSRAWPKTILETELIIVIVAPDALHIHWTIIDLHISGDRIACCIRYENTVSAGKKSTDTIRGGTRIPLVHVWRNTAKRECSCPTHGIPTGGIRNDELNSDRLCFGQEGKGKNERK